MGSGGMIILDEDDCMVDIAKFYVTFSQDESCGKCTPCREGSVRMLEILEKITTGKAAPWRTSTSLKRLALLMKKTVALRAGPGRAQPGAQHAGAFPRRVPGPRGRQEVPLRTAARS